MDPVGDGIVDLLRDDDDPEGNNTPLLGPPSSSTPPGPPPVEPFEDGETIDVGVASVKEPLRVQRVTATAVFPSRGTPNAVGLDLSLSGGIVIPPFAQALVQTGLRIKVPTGTYGRIAPRSGLALKQEQALSTQTTMGRWVLYCLTTPPNSSR